MMKSLSCTFIIPAIQICFVNLSVVFIAQHEYEFSLLASVGISVCWIFNTNKIVRCDLLHKAVYVAGAAFGTALGLWVIPPLLIGG